MYNQRVERNTQPISQPEMLHGDGKRGHSPEIGPALRREAMLAVCLTLRPNTQRVATGQQGIPESAPEPRSVFLLQLSCFEVKVSDGLHLHPNARVYTGWSDVYSEARFTSSPTC